MSKSVLYAVNATAQPFVATGTRLSFGSVIRRYGCNCNLVGGNVALVNEGYFNIDANFTFEGGAAGTAIITLYNNGVAIPGASTSVTTADATIYSVTIPAIVRKTCCNETIITATISGASGTVNNASIVVEKE